MPKLLILLTDEQMKALQAVKKDDGVPMREFVRRAVDAALACREAERNAQATREWNRL